MATPYSIIHFRAFMLTSSQPHITAIEPAISIAPVDFCKLIKELVVRGGEVRADFLDVGLEWIGHGKRFSATHLNDRPVDDVGGEKPFLFPGCLYVSRWATGQQMFDELSPPEGSRVPWRMLGRQIDGFIGGQSRHAPFLDEAIIQSFLRMEVVVFEVKALQHRIVPIQLFRLTERL